MKFDFKCRKCGACCRQEGYVFLNSDDIGRMAEYLNIPEDQFISEYIISAGRMRVRGDYAKSCILYRESKCSVYPVRPKQCRTFPYWLENLKNENYLRDAARYCPGIKIIKGSC